MSKDALVEDPHRLRQETRKRVLRAIDDLDQLGLNDVLEARILALLLDSRRTVAELVQEIWGQAKGDPGYMTAYTRTRRGVQELESKGYVTTRLFGSEKPYRLTRYAIGRIAGFAGSPRKRDKLVPRKDVALYGATGMLSLLAILVGLGHMSIPNLGLAVLYPSLYVLVGFSLARLLQTISKVT